MTTAQSIITSAFRALSAIDINEQPSPNEMQVGLDTLSAMIAAWATKSLTVTDQVMTGTTANGSDEVTDVEDTTLLAVGMNVTGSGIPTGARVKSIDDRLSKITLTAAATASGTDVSLTFELLPLETKHEKGVTALLALDLAPQVGVDNIPTIVLDNARQGWNGIRAQFFRVPGSTFDLPTKPWFGNLG